MDDGRMTQCLICEAPMYRWEVRPHENACCEIVEGLDRPPLEQAVDDLMHYRRGFHERPRS